ncbi:MAG: caspase family protein [Archangium sp.]|nr:caspase family protein [Archangium sp.]
MILSALLIAQLVTGQSEPAVRRFALVVGANDGGKERVTLRYAASDAKSVATVLAQLGGVAPRDLMAIEEPKPADIGRAIDELSRRLTAARDSAGRLEVIFYYSGHSDENGLLLGQERYPYDELRRRLDQLPAEVRLAIVDACASGALTRSKGGVSRPPFLVDASNQLKGHAFLTSASIDEAAQESERLKASVFTHALVSGLRGAADTSRDGRVTLAEAYQFAFNETLARTASTRSGPQRPAFDIQLVGTGEMVLTDVRVATSQLELDPGLSGRVFVLNATGGLVVEVAKSAGAPLQLGVEPGSYRVLVDDGKGGLGQTTLALAEKQTATVTSAQLVPTAKEALVARGDEPRPYLPVDVAFAYPLSLGGALMGPPKTNFSLGVLWAREGEVAGAALSSLGTWVDGPTRGVAVGGVAYRTGGLDGVGAAGVALISTDDVRGVLVAPATIVAGSMKGVQAGAFHLVSNGAVGGQVSAVNVIAGGLLGVQVGAVNVVTGNTTGLQAGAVNLTTAELRGFQGSALNVASGVVTGAQVGVLNIGGDVTGAQVGVLNIASTVKGTQIGVLNIARESDAPIGILNVITKGQFRAAVWANETQVVNLAVKLGSRNVYSYGTVGLNPRDGARLFAGLGLGLHLDFGRFYGQLEADTGTLMWLSTITRPADVLAVNERLTVGYQFADAFSVFAGPSFTQLVSFTRSDLTALSPWGIDPRQGVRLVPGIVIGAQLF